VSTAEVGGAGVFLSSLDDMSSLSGTADWETLSRHLSGDLVLPPDPRYGQARELQIAHFDQIRPQAVAYCADERDVQAVLAFAQESGVHVTPRSGGHSFGGYSTTEGIVLDVSRINQITVADGGERVFLGAGTQQVDALAAVTQHGLGLVSGICPSVGVGGFLQGGGVGWQTRKFGLGSDRLRSADVVLANGKLVRAAADENPDLFWGLQGNGGGNFGVVTRYELEPVRLPTMVNYMLWFTWDDAQRLIEQWQRWAIDSPNDLSASLIVMNPLDPAAGDTPQIFFFGTWYRSPEELDKHLDTVVDAIGVQPAMRSVAEKPLYDATMEYYGCADKTVEESHRVGSNPKATMPRDNFYRTRCRMYGGPVPDATVSRLLETFTADKRDGQYRMLYFETLGGQANTRGRTDTAYVHRTTEMLTGFTGTLTNPAYTPEDATALEAWLADGFRELGPGSLPECYQNYMDPALTDWREAYYAENWDRLVEVKNQYDPHRFFHFAQSIG
jgi:FAD/FMN-containing dehydrogenase